MQSDGAAADGHDGFEPRLRLHESSWLFGVVGYAKTFVVPLIAAMILGSNRDFALWLPVAALVPMIAAAMWTQWVYRYGFSTRGLVIHEGMFFRNVRTIDYGRIENVDTERGLLHRLLGVAEVRVETSTGGSAEARIRVLDLAAVEDMRQRIFAHRRRSGGEEPAAPEATDEQALLRLAPADLVLFGLIDNRGMIVVAAMLGVLGQTGFFENIEEWIGPVLEGLPWEDVAAFGVATRVMLGFATAVVLIALTRVLSVLLALTTLYDFTLTRAADDLHTRYGLLTRISITLRRPRIQSVHQTATLLHRLFRRVSLRVDLAGGVARGEAEQHGGRSSRRELWLAPLARRIDAEELIRVALPRVHLSELHWQTLAPRARWRIFRVLSLSWLTVAVVPAAWFAGAWAMLILPAALPLIWLHAALYVKHTGWALHEELFAVKRGWLTRRLAVAPRNRIQSVRLRESPFDRRYRMAGLSVDNAGATSSSHRFVLSYLDRTDAERLAAALYRSSIAESGARDTQHGAGSPDEPVTR